MELIENQGIYFLSSVLWGVFIFFFYDLLRIFRKLIPHSLLFYALEDLIFWLLSAIFVFQMIFERNNGILRIFFIFAFVFGMYTYYSLIKDYFVNQAVKVILFILRPLTFIIKKIKKMIKFVLKKVRKFFIMTLQRKKKGDKDEDE